MPPGQQIRGCRGFVWSNAPIRPEALTRVPGSQLPLLDGQGVSANGTSYRTFVVIFGNHGSCGRQVLSANKMRQAPPTSLRAGARTAAGTYSAQRIQQLH